MTAFTAEGLCLSAQPVRPQPGYMDSRYIQYVRTKMSFVVFYMGGLGVMSRILPSAAYRETERDFATVPCRSSDATAYLHA
jgi:hypothetical protein